MALGNGATLKSRAHQPMRQPAPLPSPIRIVLRARLVGHNTEELPSNDYCLSPKSSIALPRLQRCSSRLASHAPTHRAIARTVERRWATLSLHANFDVHACHNAIIPTVPCRQTRAKPPRTCCACSCYRLLWLVPSAAPIRRRPAGLAAAEQHQWA